MFDLRQGWSTGMGWSPFLGACTAALRNVGADLAQYGKSYVPDFAIKLRGWLGPIIAIGRAGLGLHFFDAASSAITNANE